MQIVPIRAGKEDQGLGSNCPIDRLNAQARYKLTDEPKIRAQIGDLAGETALTIFGAHEPPDMGC